MNKQQLINFAEENFNSQHGQRRAFFELPQLNADPVRLTYVSYVVKAETEEQGCQWMHDNVFKPLAEKTDYDGYLWWRLDECISTEFMSDGMLLVRTRMAVADKGLTPVVMVDCRHPEGGKVLTLRAVPEGIEVVDPMPLLQRIDGDGES